MKPKTVNVIIGNGGSFGGQDKAMRTLITITLCLMMAGTASASDLTAEDIRSQLEDCHVEAKEVKGEDPIRFMRCVEEIEKVLRGSCEYVQVYKIREGVYGTKCLDSIPCPNGGVR